MLERNMHLDVECCRSLCLLIWLVVYDVGHNCKGG